MVTGAMRRLDDTGEACESLKYTDCEKAMNETYSRLHR
jgi:hypothetical protein